MLPFYGKLCFYFGYSDTLEGRVATVTSVGLECGGREACRRTDGRLSDGEGVWSWHPWAGAKRAGESPQATVTKRSWTPGRARTTPLTPSRRESRSVSVNLWWTCSCAFIIRTRGCGCTQHPVFPAPSLSFEGVIVRKDPGAIAPRECGVTSLCRHAPRRPGDDTELLFVRLNRKMQPSSLRGATATKQSRVLLGLDCFAEPVIGRAFARPVGSQ